METRTNPLGWPSWAWRCLFLLAAVLVAHSLTLGLSQLARAAMVLRDLGDSGPRVPLALNGGTSLIMVAIALLVVLRGRNDPRTVLLGLVLLPFATRTAGGGLPWANSEPLMQILNAIGFLAEGTSYAFFCPLFCMVVSGGAHSHRQRRTVKRIAWTLGAMLVLYQFNIGRMSSTYPFATLFITAILMTTVMATSLGILLWNYRTSDAPSRNRIEIVFLAFVAYLLSWLLGDQARWFAQDDALGWSPLLAAGSLLTSLFGTALIAYAVLSQKLFNLNFVLNRTLVYAAVSFVLLAAFGLAKWVIEHLIPESWHAGSEYYSVAIALVLFLILHRVHNGVERNIERFLFSPWHRNEEALRRFVTAAGHFDQTAVLCRTFAEELSRFAKGAGAALYLREAGGSYSLGCGTLAEAPARYEGDDLALALMRAERRPLRTAEMQSALPGVLALPMLDHGKLAGFALLDRKPDGTDYRPDEVEILGWAAHQVGLDLQAMRASELEAEVAGLNATVAALSAQLSAAGTRRRARARAGDAA